MKSLLKYLCLCLLISFLPGAHASSIQRGERDLIAIVNLSILAEKYKPMYRVEEKRAAKKIVRDLGPYYRKVHLYSGDQATRENFLRSIQLSESEPKVKAIDVIIYLHGHPQEVGFVDTGFYPTDRIRDDVLALAPKKLRALYSDSCYGETHMTDWLKAGFKVASGSVDVDTNWSADLKRFMVSWRMNQPFAKGIARANSVTITRLTDWIAHGNSHKKVDGETHLTIDTDL